MPVGLEPRNNPRGPVQQPRRVSLYAMTTDAWVTAEYRDLAFTLEIWRQLWIRPGHYSTQRIRSIGNSGGRSNDAASNRSRSE
jgi:hypothetical protein